jgi:hypothetical protein
MKNLNFNFFLFITIFFFFLNIFLISEYVNADIEEQIRRVCSSRIGYINWFYYELYIFIENLLNLDSCQFLKNYKFYNFHSYLSFYKSDDNLLLNNYNYTKIIISILVFIILILIIQIKKNFNHLITLTTPPVFYSLSSMSSDVFVAFFIFLFFLLCDNNKKFLAYFFAVSGIFFTDKSYYVFFLFLIIKTIYQLKNNLLNFFIVSLLVYSLSKIISVNIEFFDLSLILKPEFIQSIISTVDTGNFAFINFFLTYFATNNFVLINFFNYLFFIFYFFRNKVYTKFQKELIISIYIFIFFSTLIGGVAMARHYIFIVIIFNNVMLQNMNIFQKKILYLSNISFILFVLYYYFNVNLVNDY